MAAFVGSRRFPSVTCHNKKDGRKEACDIALRQLIAEGQFQAEAAKEASVRFYLTQNHTIFLPSVAFSCQKQISASTGPVSFTLHRKTDYRLEICIF